MQIWAIWQACGYSIPDLLRVFVSILSDGIPCVQTQVFVDKSSTTNKYKLILYSRSCNEGVEVSYICVVRLGMSLKHLHPMRFY